MTIRKNLTSILLTGTILLGGSVLITPNAEANADAWMVKKVSKASQPYCAMIKRYSNDRVLSFAQRDDAEISTAIDFGDKFLDKGRAYSITLSDGDGFSRRFEVKPASSSAVVIKMNRKDPIIERISQKGDLSVNIAGVVSTFNVADLDKGLDQLESCSIGAPAMRSADASSASAMANIAPAAGDSVIDTQSSAHSLYSTAANAKIRELEAAKKDLERAIKENEGKIAALENQILSTENNAKTQQVALVNEVTNLKAALEQQAMETSQLKVKLTDRDEKIAFYQSMDTQVSELQSKLSAAEANMAAAMQQNNALSAQIVTLQSASSQVGEQGAMIGQLNAQIAQLKQMNTSLNQEIAQLRNAAAAATPNMAAVSQKDAEIARLNATIASLQQALAASAPAAGDSAEDMANAQHISALGAKLKAVEAEKEALNVQLAAMQREMDTVSRGQMDDSKYQLTISRLEKALDEANFSLDKAGKENAALYQKMVQTEKALEEVRLTKSESKNWDTEKATARYEEAQREIRRLAMHLENSKKQCEMEKADIEQLLFDPKITAKEQQQKLSSLETKIGELNKAQQSCAAKLAEYDDMAHGGKVAMNQAAAAAQIQPAAGAMPAVVSVPEASAPVIEDRSVALISVLKDSKVADDAKLKEYKSPLNVANADYEQGYSWTSGNITGSYERFVVKGNSDLAAWSGAYNTALSEMCSGDFAVMPSKKNTASISANDTACVNGDFGTTTSIVFTQTGDYLDVYKLSGTIQDMAKLMDSRENIAKSVGKAL